MLYEAEAFNIDLIAGAAGPGDGELPTELSFIELEGDGLVVNAVKKGEWDDSLIVRISNPTTKSIDGAIRLQIPFSKVETVNLMETEVQEELKATDGRVSMKLLAKKIVTFRFLL